MMYLLMEVSFVFICCNYEFCGEIFNELRSTSEARQVGSNLVAQPDGANQAEGGMRRPARRGLLKGVSWARLRLAKELHWSGRSSTKEEGSAKRGQPKIRAGLSKTRLKSK